MANRLNLSTGNRQSGLGPPAQYTPLPFQELIAAGQILDKKRAPGNLPDFPKFDVHEADLDDYENILGEVDKRFESIYEKDPTLKSPFAREGISRTSNDPSLRTKIKTLELGKKRADEMRSAISTDAPKNNAAGVFANNWKYGQWDEQGGTFKTDPSTGREYVDIPEVQALISREDPRLALRENADNMLSLRTYTAKDTPSGRLLKTFGVEGKKFEDAVALMGYRYNESINPDTKETSVSYDLVNLQIMKDYFRTNSGRSLMADISYEEYLKSGIYYHPDDIISNSEIFNAYLPVVEQKYRNIALREAAEVTGMEEFYSSKFIPERTTDEEGERFPVTALALPTSIPNKVSETFFVKEGKIHIDKNTRAEVLNMLAKEGPPTMGVGYKTVAFLQTLFGEKDLVDEKNPTYKNISDHARAEGILPVEPVSEEFQNTKVTEYLNKRGKESVQPAVNLNVNSKFKKNFNDIFFDSSTKENVVGAGSANLFKFINQEGKVIPGQKFQEDNLGKRVSYSGSIDKVSDPHEYGSSLVFVGKDQFIMSPTESIKSDPAYTTNGILRASQSHLFQNDFEIPAGRFRSMYKVTDNIPPVYYYEVENLDTKQKAFYGFSDRTFKEIENPDAKR